MNIFVVDTNLLFSAVRNPHSRIARVLLNTTALGVKLFAPTYTLEELVDHLPRLVAKSSLTARQATHNLEQLLLNIEIVEDAAIPIPYWMSAARLTYGVDEDDTAFVALTESLDELLWTGDRKLYEGLRAKGYQKVVSFTEVKKLLSLPADF